MATERHATMRGTVNDSPRRTDDLLQKKEQMFNETGDKPTHLGAVPTTQLRESNWTKIQI